MTGREPPSIRTLPAAVADLPPSTRQRFEALYQVVALPSRLRLPPEMRGWVNDVFDSTEAVEHQSIVRVTNRVTAEEALFNTLRARRPIDIPTESYGGGDLASLLEASRGDPFCHPYEQTPEDVFGRVVGTHSLTASNIAKVDAYHAVVIFHEHNPLVFDADQVADYLRTGLAWGERVRSFDPTARFWLFWWNALWKSGASILHGHAQVVSRPGCHYGRLERTRRSVESYRARCGRDYFEDLLAVHQALGLTVDHGSARAIAALTPIKERELWVMDPHGLTDSSLALVYRVLDYYVNVLGIQSFNVAYLRPPLGEPSTDVQDWQGFPHLFRIVDRGPVDVPMADMGGLELFGATSVAHDPFALIEGLRHHNT